MKQYINENERALIIYKRMNYDYGKELLEKEDYEIAIGYLTQADDYNNSAELLLETRINLYKKHINRGEYTEAVQLYNQFLASTGIIQEYFLMDIGDQGEIITEIFNLARALGYEIPKNEKIYQERYVKNIQKLEDHFGFKADGRITCSEYVTIHNMIYVGKSGSNIQAVLEQLADLSYMEKLPEKHTTYETKYVNSVKKAERKLGLQEDGIITENEYKVIMRQYVEVPAQVENLKVSVNKDTVTISWSKVTGAVCYEIRCDDVFLGTTEKTNWVDKDVETGTYKFYKVIAKKYSKASLASTKGITIPKYYYSVGLSELTKNSNSYKGKYVKLSNLTISNWYVSDSKGEHVKSSLAISTAQKYDNYNVNFICKAGEHYVWIIMENYKGWDWEDTQNDILGKIKRITNISVSGKVESTMLTVESKKMVKVVIDEISWRFR